MFLLNEIENSLVIGGRLEIRIHALHANDQLVALLFQFLLGAELARVQPLPVRTVDRLRGRGSGRRGISWRKGEKWGINKVPFMFYFDSYDP